MIKVKRRQIKKHMTSTYPEDISVVGRYGVTKWRIKIELNCT
jgi:hypothetical protein